MKDLVIKVKEILEKYNCQNKKLLLAFSGGKDSVCLLNILLYLKDILNFKLYTAYVNHNLRDQESQKEKEFIINYLKNKKVICFKLTIKKEYWEKVKKDSIEMRARKIRYNFFNKILKKYKLDYILTAHHFNDKIETFFLNLIRGTGVESLISIPEKNKNIIRPLLYITQNQIYSYIKNNNLTYIEDSSNKKNIYQRNIIRNKIIPVIKNIKPDYYKSFQKFFKFYYELLHFLNRKILFYFRKCIKIKTNFFIEIDKQIFDKFHIYIKKSIIKLILKKLKLKNCINITLFKKIIYENSKKYTKKSLYIENRMRKIWFINLKRIKKINLNIEKIKKEPLILNKINNKAIIELNFYKKEFIIIKSINEKVINKNLKNFFIISNNINIFPIKIEPINFNDKIKLNDINKKIINYLKDYKIPSILFNHCLKIIDKENNIIGFIFYKYFRLNKNFFINNENENYFIINMI